LIRLPSKPPPRWHKGDKVFVTRGAFEGLSGLYQGQAPHERVKILLSLLGASRTVELAAEDVERTRKRGRRISG
jgi:transcription antitermination factor NusG